MIGVCASRPRRRSTRSRPGEVGILAATIKDIVARAGRRHRDRCGSAGDGPLPGFKTVKPMVFAGLFPVDAAHYQDLRTRSASSS